MKCRAALHLCLLSLLGACQYRRLVNPPVQEALIHEGFVDGQRREERSCRLDSQALFFLGEDRKISRLDKPDEHVIHHGRSKAQPHGALAPVPIGEAKRGDYQVDRINVSPSFLSDRSRQMLSSKYMEAKTGYYHYDMGHPFWICGWTVISRQNTRSARHGSGTEISGPVGCGRLDDLVYSTVDAQPHHIDSGLGTYNDIAQFHVVRPAGFSVLSLQPTPPKNNDSNVCEGGIGCGDGTVSGWGITESQSSGPLIFVNINLFNTPETAPIQDKDVGRKLLPSSDRKSTVCSWDLENDTCQVIELTNNIGSNLSDDTVALLSKSTYLQAFSLVDTPSQCDCSIRPQDFLLRNNLSRDAGSNRILLEVLNRDNPCDDHLITNPSLFLLCLAFILVGVFAFLTGLYYHYRERFMVYCYSSPWKVFRRFVPQTETNENKVYDAFISFANEDINFVTQHLVPRLEGNGDSSFKLCLHYRDWMVGELIPRQILWSVQNSRRTIVVLSPNYLKSTWGQMEFKTAHTIALQEGTSRVVVLMYQDVAPIQELDGELATYLKWYTYIRWDSPWFWEQLFYAMPHRYIKSHSLIHSLSCCQRSDDPEHKVSSVPLNIS